MLFGGLVETVGLPGPRQMYRASDTWVCRDSSPPPRAPERRTSLTAVSGDELGPMLLFSGRRAVLTPEGGLVTYPEGTGYTNDVWEFGS